MGWTGLACIARCSSLMTTGHLCFLWEDQRGYNGTEFPVVHCNKIRVSIYKGAQGESRFDAVVVASRSYVLLGPNEIILNAHIFLGEEDEGGERGSGLGGYDHGGRTWERCGYGGGGRYALDIAPIKKCPKCSFPGHIERDCKVTPCFRCMGFGHVAMDCKGLSCFRCRGFGLTAMDCKGIFYCSGGGWYVSSSGSWVGQPPIQ